jgi:hypothetical protein
LREFRSATQPPPPASQQRLALARTRGSFTYIGSPNGPIQRLEPVRLGMSNVQYGCYEATARSETRKLARVRPARCPAWRLENVALKVAKVESGHLARANGAIDGPLLGPLLFEHRHHRQEGTSSQQSWRDPETRSHRTAVVGKGVCTLHKDR